MNNNTLQPFVYWAQTRERIILRVDLTKVTDEVIQINKQSIDFKAVGNGNQGDNVYSFNLILLNSLIPEKSEFKVKDRGVYFDLKKENERIWWSNLSEKGKKLPWVRIDFEKWKLEGEEEEKGRFFNDNMNEKMRQEDIQGGDKRVEFRIVYLVLYNMVQFIGYTFVIIVLGIRYLKEGDQACARAWFYVSSAVKFVQVLQVLEIMHRFIRYTQGNILKPLLQTGGRAIILFALLNPEPKLQRDMSVFYLFMIWSLVEIFQYPYYIFRTCRREFRLLTWLRYTVWIPLYPAGFISEGIIILKAIPLLDESRNFTLDLPNVWNVSFNFALYLRIYLLIFCFPLMYFKMSDMARQRNIRLKISSCKKKE